MDSDQSTSGKAGWAPDVAKRRSEREEVKRELEEYAAQIVALQRHITELNEAIGQCEEPPASLIDSLQKLSAHQASYQMLVTLNERRLKRLNEYIALAESDIH